MSERADIRRSPLSEIVSSPRSRELRIIREKDRMIKVFSLFFGFYWIWEEIYAFFSLLDNTSLDSE